MKGTKAQPKVTGGPSNRVGQREHNEKGTAHQRKKGAAARAVAIGLRWAVAFAVRPIAVGRLR